MRLSMQYITTLHPVEYDTNGPNTCTYQKFPAMHMIVGSTNADLVHTCREGAEGKGSLRRVGYFDNCPNHVGAVQYLPQKISMRARFGAVWPNAARGHGHEVGLYVTRERDSHRLAIEAPSQLLWCRRPTSSKKSTHQPLVASIFIDKQI
jgi:hypothetical protein